MSQIKGPAVFLAQFVTDEPPFNTLESIASWVKSLGFIGVQIPVWNKKLIDLDEAAQSKDYCDGLKGICSGLEITELATHMLGRLVAVHPTYDILCDALAPPQVQDNQKARTEWAVDQMKKAITASRNLGLKVIISFTGSLLWQYVYPFPPRPAGLVDTAFNELARRWQPILDFAADNGVEIAYEISPGNDVHDGVTFERFLEATGNHPSVKINYDPSHFLIQCLDYAGFITCYKDFIKAFHVKDAEFNPSPRSGVYGGFQQWKDRPGRFRSLGDGQVDFKKVFTKMTEIGYDSWAVLEWECCVKDSEQGAREGAGFIKAHLIDVPKRAWDKYMGGGADSGTNRKILGLG